MGTSSSRGDAPSLIGSTPSPAGSRVPVATAVASLGIVFGDIGTSPIHAFREAFDHSRLTADEANAFGIASVVFWALIVVISIKYLAFVMRADNHGEGGILALTALVLPRTGTVTGAVGAVVTLGVFGTALLYGDGLITPAISVLSAVEGFEIASTTFESWVLPISIGILVGLFALPYAALALAGIRWNPQRARLNEALD